MTNRLDPLPFSLVADAAVSLAPPPVPAPTIWDIQRMKAGTPMPPTPEKILSDVLSRPTADERADLNRTARVLTTVVTSDGRNLLGTVAPRTLLSAGIGARTGLVTLADQQTAARSTFQTVRPSIENADVFLKMWQEYPWPGVDWIWRKALIESAGSVVHRMIDGPRPVSPLAARDWTTITIGAEWTKLSERYNAIQEKELRQDQRRALVRSVALTALGAIVSAGLASLSAGAGTSTVGADAQGLLDEVTGRIGKLQNKAAGRSLAEMSKAMQEAEPLFATELGRVAEKFGEHVFDEAPEEIPASPGADAATIAGKTPGLFERFLWWIEDLLT